MIEWIEGVLIKRSPTHAIVNVNGVGYGLEVTQSALTEPTDLGSKVTLWVDTYVREDAIRLFGFVRENDRLLFSLLRGVSGIGPKSALAILTVYDADELKPILKSGQIESLVGVPGIGKRTAEKLLLELKPKIEKDPLFFSGPMIGASKGPIDKSKDADFFDERDLKGIRTIDSVFSDVKSALENLGYKEREFDKALQLVKSQQSSRAEPVAFHSLLKEVLGCIRQH
jgi:Holliday junction DNA helicase RuvA